MPTDSQNVRLSGFERTLSERIATSQFDPISELAPSYLMSVGTISSSMSGRNFAEFPHLLCLSIATSSSSSDRGEMALTTPSYNWECGIDLSGAARHFRARPNPPSRLISVTSAR
jgi:hypothetical protein